MVEEKKKKIKALKKELDTLLGDQDSQTLLDVVEELRGQTKRFEHLEETVKELTKTKELSEIKELVGKLVKLLNELDISVPKKFNVDVDNWPEQPKGTRDVKVVNFPEQKGFPKSVEVSNFPEQKEFPRKIEVENLHDIPEFPKKIDVNKPGWFKQLTKKELASAIGQALASLSKQEMTIDLDKYRDPGRALAVRLSDGRKFYQALAGVVEAMGRGQAFPFVDSNGKAKQALLDEDGHLQVDIIENTLRVSTPVTFEDPAFVVGDSPAVLDCNTELGRNATEFSIQNDGIGDFTVSISNDGSAWGDEKTVKSGEVYEINNISVDSIRITHVADSAYRVTAL